MKTLFLGFYFLLFISFSSALSSENFTQTFLVRGSYEQVKELGEIIKILDRNLYLVKMRNENLISAQKSGVIIEPNYKLKKLGEIIPNDPCNAEKWELSYINAFSAWNITTGSEEILVAVLDTGVDYNNPDLRRNLWKNPEEICGNNLDDDGNGYVDDCYGVNVLCYPNGNYDPNAEGCNAPDALDDDGHGTHLAGIIGAIGNNSILISGINWNIKIVPCKFLDSNGLGDIAGEYECLKYIKTLKQEGYNIVAVNASYGGIYPFSQIQYDAIKELENLGILYITAAGNEGRNIDILSFFPCNYELNNILCVGAFNRNGSPTYFSNYGFNNVDILAPGEDILSLRLNGDSSCENGLIIYDGTSMATAFVTGAVALLHSMYLEQGKKTSLAEVKERILTGGTNTDTLDGKVYTCNRLNLFNILRDNGEGPKVCLSVSRLDFGLIELNSYKTGALTVRNTGTIPIIISSVYSSSQYVTWESDCIGRQLNTFEECQINVTFFAQKTGTFEETLTLIFAENGLTRTVTLSANVYETKDSINSSTELNISSESSSSNGLGCNSIRFNFWTYTAPIFFYLLGRFLKFRRK